MLVTHELKKAVFVGQKLLGDKVSAWLLAEITWHSQADKASLADGLLQPLGL